jgi:hypothetical protein
MRTEPLFKTVPRTCNEHLTRPLALKRLYPTSLLPSIPWPVSTISTVPVWYMLTGQIVSSYVWHGPVVLVKKMCDVLCDGIFFFHFGVHSKQYSLSPY